MVLIPNSLQIYPHSCMCMWQDIGSTRSVGTRRAQTHRPLSRPTPHTLMLTMGCEWRTVRSMGSIRFSMSFSRIRYMSLPCNSRKGTVTEYVPLSKLGSRCYAYIFSWDKPKLKVCPTETQSFNLSQEQYRTSLFTSSVKKIKDSICYCYIFELSQLQKPLISFKRNCLTHSTTICWITQSLILFILSLVNSSKYSRRTVLIVKACINLSILLGQSSLLQTTRALFP